MVDPELAAIVRAKLDESPSLSTGAGLLVLAALEGEEQLRSTLEDGEDVQSDRTPATRERPAGAYLSSLTVEGFRGIGSEATLQFRAGPGLTLVVGRNGSGKSSFAEAFEVLLCGDTRRWSDRSQIWRQGWRNLHHIDSARIHAELFVEGQRGLTAVERDWSTGAELAETETTVQHKGDRRSGIERLGWGAALQTHRPFLSYNELGSMFDEGPSKLYDALSSILGLESLTLASKCLRDARLSRSKCEKDLKRELAERILPMFDEATDPRARACMAALSTRSPDLEALEAVLVSDDGAASSDANLRLLAELASVKGPALTTVARVADDLRQLESELARVAGTDAELAGKTALLLETVLDLRPDGEDIDCPVCSVGELDDEWEASAHSRIECLREAAVDADRAHAAVDQTTQELALLLPPMPAALSHATEVAVDSERVVQCWQTLIDGIPNTGFSDVAEHLETVALELDEALQAMRNRAEEERQRREDAWRPVSLSLASFLERAGDIAEGTRQIPPLKEAEGWLKEALADIRDARFAPISERAAAIWSRFQQHSNVSLSQVVLDGSGTRRRVVLDVTVDGAGGPALAVMSQGELHALALSLFLPRATLPDSPFRLVVIDDPVQAMDPARVDGLARVLEDASRERQVIVFTHDERLPETIRRLQIDADVLEVVRRKNSVVEVRDALDPVSRYLEDASALALTDDLPPGVGSRVVPGFCRFAVEAACADLVRARRFRRGEKHSEIEDLVRGAGKLSQRLALALFDDPLRGGQVLPTLNDRYGGWAGDVYVDCNKGSHQGCPDGRLYGLVTDTRRLVAELEKLQ